MLNAVYISEQEQKADRNTAHPEAGYDPNAAVHLSARQEESVLPIILSKCVVLHGRTCCWGGYRFFLSASVINSTSSMNYVIQTLLPESGIITVTTSMYYPQIISQFFYNNDPASHHLTVWSLPVVVNVLY